MLGPLEASNRNKQKELLPSWNLDAIIFISYQICGDAWVI